MRNDIGFMWSPACKPIVLAIYTVRYKNSEKSRDDIVASTARIISTEFAKHDNNVLCKTDRRVCWRYM